jgi:hypothetical protein
MSLRQTAAPTAEPVSLDALKLHLRIDGSDEDDLLTAFTAAARGTCESFQGRAYVAQTWRVTLDRFPGGGEEWTADKEFVASADPNAAGTIRVPRPPLISVTSIAYVDTDGDSQTLDAADYTVDTASEPGRIVPAYGEDWPSTREQPGAVTVTFVAGYATPFTADAATNILTAAGRALTSGEVVRLTNEGGELPGGLAADTDYYARDISGRTFKLALTDGGVAIDLTSAGSGTHFIGDVPAMVRTAVKMLAGHYYENREGAAAGLPPTVESLLWQERCF